MANRWLLRSLFVRWDGRRILGGRDFAREGFAQLLLFLFLLLGEVSLALRKLVVGLGQLAILCVVVGRGLGESMPSRVVRAKGRSRTRPARPPPSTLRLLHIAQRLAGNALDQDPFTDLEQHVEHDA